LLATTACLQVVFKLDKAGSGEEVQLRDLPQCKELALQGFDHQLFQEVRRPAPMPEKTPSARFSQLGDSQVGSCC
jgi:hypothetical protein